MNSNIAISLEDVSKAYTVWKDPSARLKHPLLNLMGKISPSLRRRIDKKLEGLCSEFYALRNISFEVKKGESMGIIGRNGSGKSTLLQIIAGTLQPSKGFVRVNGRVAALLELGSGFNPEFTGRQNVYLNASILGMTHQETEVRFADIEAFAEIGDFMDQPVKTYSSGMSVRLAFAVQAMIDPDILIIDEALAVGDYFFQQKCARKMRELKEKGTTLLFVSHDLGVVRDLCREALYLKQGKASYYGPSEKAINYYLNERVDSPRKEVKERAAISYELMSQYLDQLRPEAAWFLEPAEVPKKLAGAILGVIVSNESGMVGGKIKMGEKITIKVVFLSLLEQNFHVAIEFKNRYDQIINSTSSYTCNEKSIPAHAGELVEMEFCFDLMIEAGKYSYQVTLSQESVIPNRGEHIHETSWLGPLEVEWDYEHQRAPFLGMFGIPAEIQVIRKQKYTY
ncbi:MAG: ABC transporter ATP-binding protein [Chthoniobacterales bacterium]